MTSAATQGWRRLSPIALVFFLLKSLKHFGPDAWPLYAGGFAWFASADDATRSQLLMGLGGVLLVTLLWGVLSYLRYSYRIQDQTVAVRRGVLQREQLTIEYDRVQNVSVNSPFYARPFGRATLQVDTAGSQGEEVSLPGLPIELARKLRESILVRAESTAQDAAPETDLADPSEPLATTSNTDLIIHGLSNNMAIWFAVVAGPLFGSDIEWWDYIDLSVASEYLGLEDSLAGSIILLVGLVFFAAVLLTLFSVVGSFLRYYNYQLTRRGDTFQMEAGLLSRNAQSTRQHKIQAVQWKQNLIARLFGRFNLHIRQAKAGTVEGAEAMQQKKQSFIIPARTADDAATLSQLLLQGWQPQAQDYTRMDRRFIRTRVAIQVAFISPFLVTAALNLSAWFWPLMALVALMLWRLAERRWRESGFRLDRDYLYVQTGMLGRKMDIFELYRLQRVDMTQSWLKQRAGLADVTLYLGSHTVHLHFIPVEMAEQLRDLGVASVETSKLAWI